MEDFYKDLLKPIPEKEDEEEILPLEEDDDLGSEQVDIRLEQFKEDKWVSEILDKGLDIWEYAKQTQRNLTSSEAQLVMDFMELMPTILELNENVEKCDGILLNMSSSLEQFKAHLGDLNQAINSLQLESKQIQIKLKNRMQVHTRLAKTIHYLSLDPKSIAYILNGKIDSTYVHYINELDIKMAFLQKKGPIKKNSSIKAIKEISPELDRLRFKASSDIRKHILNIFKSMEYQHLSKTKENINDIKKQKLLPIKKLIHFLMQRHLGVAIELSQHYTNLLSTFNLFHFDAYIKGLTNCLIVMDHDRDLIGLDEQAKRGFMDFKIFNNNSVNLKDRYNLYQLGNRDKILQFQEYECIPVINNSNKYKMEEIFKSINVSLSASLLSEYLFLKQFFNPKYSPDTQDLSLDYLMKNVFESIIKKIHHFFKSMIDASFDIIGILLCIRLNQQFHYELITNNKVCYVDINYFHINERILWVRFQALFNQHINSIKKNSYIPTDQSVHFITKRYAELVQSILLLCFEYGEPMLLNGILRLRNEYFMWLDRLAFKSEKKKYVFLINNDHLVLNKFNEYSNENIDKEIEIFKEKYKTDLNSYIHIILKSNFNELLINDNLEKSNLNEVECNNIINHFQNSWKQGLENIYMEVQATFTHLKEDANSILHSILAQLLLYYTKFLAFLDTNFPNLCKLCVPAHALMLQVKKYRSGV